MGPYSIARICYSLLCLGRLGPETGSQLDMCKACEYRSKSTDLFMWDLLLEANFGWLLRSQGRRWASGQSGYLYMYPFLLLLRDAGATGLAGVLCPRGNTPLLQQGEPDTHKQHQESRRGTNGEKREWKGRKNRKRLSSAARQ